MCSTGLEQSPIDLSTVDFQLSDKMELNGYGYEDFRATRSGVAEITYETEVTNGEFILNLWDGRKQLFKPV